MYYFDEGLYQKAIDLVKHCKDFADAANDIDMLTNINNNYNPYTMSDQYLSQVDHEMKRKYPDIYVMQNIADRIPWRKTDYYAQTYIPLKPELEQLKFDCFCILAYVLKTAKEITDLAEFFDKDHIDRMS